MKAVKIKSIKVTDDRIITMDINVDEVHHYILDDGTISHNSSISGATTNGLYPIRDIVLNKTNETQSVSYVVPDSTKLRNRYESAWEIPTDNMTMIYAIFQKWCDQGISADRWRKIQGDEKVGTKEMITGFNTRYKYGVKQGYYQNTKGGKDINLNASEAEAECESCSI